MNEEIDLFEGEEGEVVEDEGEALPAIIDADRMIEIAEKAEKMVLAQRKIINAALSITNPQDWIDFNGKPYLELGGAEKIAKTFGISWDAPKMEIEFIQDGHYNIRFSGHIYDERRSIYVIGGTSSRNKFFAGASQDKPVDDIDRNEVIKKALTNWMNNGIKRIMGIRNLTWEEVERITGIKRDDTSQVRFKTGDQATERLRTDVWDMLMQMADGDEKRAKAMLSKATEFSDKETGEVVKGKTDISKVSSKQLEVVNDIVTKNFNAYLKKMGGK